MSQLRKKVLLMGKHASGKTSMRSVVFANYLARDTSRLGPTMNVEHAHVRFLNNLVLNLWDCGGQDRFYRSYFESQRDHIFRNVELLVYVFDVKSVDEKDLQFYRESLDSLMALSENAHVVVMIHKVDPADGEARMKMFKDVEARILARSEGVRTTCFATSIFDDSLVRAWSHVIEALVPNLGEIQSKLREVLDATGAEEIILLERATCLVVTSATSPGALARDVSRFQKLTACIKSFRVSCSAAQNAFEAIELRNADFASVLDRFTDTTSIFVMTATSKHISPELVAWNVAAARPAFEKLLSCVP
jgi:Ras-related GTP-binding protein A/B